MKRTLVDDCFRPSQPRLRHDEAIEILKQAVAPLPATLDVALNNALGRVLAQDIAAPQPVPAHTNSAVDGYAFAHSGYKVTDRILRLNVVGRSAAGHPFPFSLGALEAARIFTGAVMPEGADTVAMQEDAEVIGKEVDCAGELRSTVIIPAGLKLGANVRKAGEDVAAGTTLYTAGSILRPHDLAALASIGCATVPCYDRLRVAIVSTGDEVRDAGSGPLAPGEVYDANTPMLSALATLAGANVTQLGVWKDHRASVVANLAKAAKHYDVILTSGGASLGEEDHMAAALSEIGQRHLWQLAIKPGRPMMFGQIRSGGSDSIVIGLPGNPVAVFVCFLMYVYPLLRAAGGAAWTEPRRFVLPAAFEFKGRKQGRREFWRGRIAQTETGMTVEKFARDGSGLISGLRWSDGLIEIPEDCGDIAAGDPVAFIPYSEFGIV
ncbi:MAG: gephyrin-like molybdotransferase Glp [Hyphomicrobiaceae bacterium]